MSLSTRLASLRTALRSKGYGRGYRIVGRPFRVCEESGAEYGSRREEQTGAREIARAARPGERWWIEIEALLGPERDSIVADLDWNVPMSRKVKGEEG